MAFLRVYPSMQSSESNSKLVVSLVAKLLVTEIGLALVHIPQKDLINIQTLTLTLKANPKPNHNHKYIMLDYMNHMVLV